jgi:hypothetical protein
MPAGDVFGLDGFFLNKSNPITVSTIGINSTGSSAGIEVVSGTLDSTAGIATLTFASAAGLSTTPFYIGTKIAVSGLSTAGVAYTGYNGTFVVTGFAGTTTVSYATTGYVGSVTASITALGLVMLVTDTAVTNTTWSSAQTHGWFGGGATPTTISTVDRIDFSNDTGTANIRGPLTSTRYKTAATGNSNYGWFGGGGPGPVSIVNRINFSNDSTTAAPRGSLSLSRQYLAATGNSNYGWFGGGAPATAIVDRIDFSNDSGVSLVRGSLNAPNGRFGLASTGNSNYGWFGGGNNALPAAVSLVDRIDFSNDSPSATLRGVLSQARWYLAATGNSNYGWFGGGTTTGTSGVVTIDRIDFANDSSTASVRGSLSAGKYFLAATGNSNYGYFGGGRQPTTIGSIVDRIDFSNDSVSASVRGPLSSIKADTGATSGQARSRSITIPKTGTYGWFGGGFVNISYVDRIDFTNDTNVSPRGNLPTGRGYVAAAGNINYGWFAGAYNELTYISRIDYSNDAIDASNRAPFSGNGIHAGSGAGNQNYGWFDHGSTGFPYTKFQRINYSNDSSSPLVRSLIPASNNKGAVGNLNYGWWGSGFLGGTAYRRLDFSNDLTTASIRGGTTAPLGVSARWQSGTSCNRDYGWFAGGKNDNPSFSSFSNVERLNFLNDTVNSVTKGSLSAARYGLSGAGNYDYGWFGGGQNSGGSNVSTVERINFSNDSVIVSTRTPLTSTSRYGSAAVSNTIRG